MSIDDDPSARQGQPLLQFSLADIQTIAPDALVQPVRRDPLAGFILSIALAFNDIKNLEMFRQAVLEKPPEPSSDATPYRGQWGGLLSFLHRYFGGVLHELLILIADNKKVVASQDFQLLIGKLSEEARAAWVELCDSATDTSPARKALMFIRNKGAFHFDPKVLIEGYREYFFRTAKTKLNASAMYSMGSDMEHSRFYFADAAAERLLPVQSADLAGVDPLAIISHTARRANAAIFEIVTAYIAERST